MEEIVAAIIGGFLAAGAGWFLQWRLESSRVNKMKELLKTGILDDLKTAIDLYDRLIDEWDKTKIVWFTTLNELRESRQIYNKNRDWLVLLNDEPIRQRIFKYYHRSADHTNLLEHQQQRKYQIQAKLNEVVRDIQLKNESIDYQAALTQAVRIMQPENQELIGIDDLLPQNIQKIRDFKGEAKELLTIIEKQ